MGKYNRGDFVKIEVRDEGSGPMRMAVAFGASLR